MDILRTRASWIDNGIHAIELSSSENEKSADGFFLSVITERTGSGRILRFRINAKKKITLESLSADMEVNLSNAKVMSNGYQTWTDGSEMDGTHRMRKLNPIARGLLKPYGDYGIVKYSGKKRYVRSWTYTYLLNENSITLVGSCSEDTGYTIFEADISKNTLRIQKDCSGMYIAGDCEIMSIYIGEGREDVLWQEYFSRITSYRSPSGRCTGWTSWYNYYTSISEDIVMHNLRALSESKIPVDVFQIDDGYQNAVGDWLEINNKFPSGMRKIADEISKCGYKPGLWMAPFVCEKKSSIFREHPDWLLKDSHGRLVKAGWNPGWSGTFYSLDIYNEAFREYLKKVFSTVLHGWGYEILKLDFLYGVCIIPNNGKSRGQVMTEAMDFIREMAGKKQILGCGVPLGPAFKRVDYCRIGSDVAPYWEDWKLKYINYRERVSTVNSLRSTLGRWQLNGRAFSSDPDVFILRENDNSMTEDERNTLFLLNNILGSLIFFSDDIKKYGKREMGLLKSMYPTVKPLIKSVSSDNNLYKVELSAEGREYIIYSNLGDFEADIIADRRYYCADMLNLKKGDNLSIRPHCTVVLYSVDDASKPFLLGAKGHILPCSQIQLFECNSDGVTLKLKEGASPDTEVYIGVDESEKSMNINGMVHDASDINGVRCIVVKLYSS